MRRLSYDNRGAVTLAAIIVLFFSALAILLSIQFAGIGEMLSGQADLRGERAFQAAESCLEEALLRLSRDPGFAGGPLSVGVDSCTVSVTGTGASRGVEAEGVSGTAIRRVMAGVTISNGDVQLVSWAEEID